MRKCIHHAFVVSSNNWMEYLLRANYEVNWTKTESSQKLCHLIEKKINDWNSKYLMDDDWCFFIYMNCPICNVHMFGYISFYVVRVGFFFFHPIRNRTKSKQKNIIILLLIFAHTLTNCGRFFSHWDKRGCIVCVNNI